MTSLDLAVARSLRLRQTFGASPHPYGHPAGCKGAACPAFAACEARRARLAAVAEPAQPVH